MAAAFTTTASALSAPNALSSRGGASGLSSGNAFQTTSIVQQGPVTSRAHRMVAARASLDAQESELCFARIIGTWFHGWKLDINGSAEGVNVIGYKRDLASVPCVAHKQKVAARREVLASILAAGAALGFGGRAVADPVQDAKVQAGEFFKTKAVEKAKGIVDENAPKLPDAGPQIEEAKKKLAGSIDNIFGKGKSGPLKSTPTSGSGSTKFQQSFGSLAVDTPSVEDAKSSVSDAKSTVQSKGGDLFGQAKDAAPDLPAKAPSFPDLPKPELPKVELPKVDLPKFGK